MNWDQLETIKKGSIRELKKPDPGHPVYFVRLVLAHDRMQADWDLVVKAESCAQGEATTQVSVHWGAKLMRHVSGGVKVKPLTRDEFTAFKEKAGQDSDFDDPANVWFKMPFLGGLTTGGMVVKGAGRSFDIDSGEKACKVAVKMLDANRWRELGKIAAVDIFIGNNDRFDVSGSPGWVENTGNFMYSASGQMVGLDTFARDGAISKLDQSVANLDFLKPLMDNNEGTRSQFASRATESFAYKVRYAIEHDPKLEGKMEGPMSGVPVQQRKGVKYLNFAMRNPKMGGTELKAVPLADLEKIYAPFRGFFADGIAVGAKELKTYLQIRFEKLNTSRARAFMAVRGGATYAPTPSMSAPKAPGEPFPAGVLERMSYLKWMPRQ